MTEEVSREAFNMLRDQVAANAARIEAIDHGGTRGVLVVQQQLTDLTKDMATLTAELQAHEKEHKVDDKERRANRNRLIGWGIAFLTAVDGPLIYLISHGKG